MSDNYIEEDFDQDLDNEEESASDLRKAARRGAKAAKELEMLRKELTFYKAGISMDDPKMRYFVKGYEGEMTAEAIREAALEAGFIASQQQAEVPTEQQQQVFSAQQRIMAASAGAGTQDNSEEAALSLMEQAMEEGGIEAMLDVARQFGMQVGEV